MVKTRCILSLASLLLLVTGCYPSSVSPACQATIDDCLRRCPPGGPAVDSPQTDFPSDSRNECERQCHERPCAR